MIIPRQGVVYLVAQVVSSSPSFHLEHPLLELLMSLPSSAIARLLRVWMYDREGKVKSFEDSPKLGIGSWNRQDIQTMFARRKRQ